MLRHLQRIIDHNTFPSGCKVCGLYEGCTNPGINGAYSGSRINGVYSGSPIDVLVVTRWPGSVEDAKGVNMVGPGADILLAWTKEFGGDKLNWAFDSALKCFPGRSRGKTVKPTASQKRSCKPLLHQNISRFKPKVILCAGVEAMEAVLSKPPKSLGAAIGAPIYEEFEWGKVPVVVTSPPESHIAMSMDLSDEYTRVFKLIQKLATGTYCEPKIHWEFCSPKEVLKRKKYEQPRIGCFDWEAGCGENNSPTARTIHHPDAIPLGISISWVPPKLSRLPEDLSIQEFCDRTTTSVIDVISHPEYLEQIPRIFDGMEWVAHNAHFDCLVHRLFTGDNIFKRIRAIWDTMLIHYLKDQGRTGNALKTIVPRLLAIAPWDDEIHKRLREFQAEWAKEVKALKKAGVPENEFPLYPDFRNFHNTQEDWYDLCEYNAKDTIYCLWLYYYLMKVDPWGKEVQSRRIFKLIHQCIAPIVEMEYNGLPMDKRRLKILRKIYQGKADEIEKQLRTTKEVQQAEIRSGTRFNSASNKFLTGLAEVTDVTDILKISKKSGNYSFAKPILPTLGRVVDSPEPEVPFSQLTRTEKIWRGVYYNHAHRDYISSFLKQYEKFVQDDGKIHTSYSMAKVQVMGRTLVGESTGGSTSGRWGSSSAPLHLLTQKGLLMWALKAKPGYVILKNDNSTIEPVVNAWVSGSQKWQEIFRLKKEDPGNPKGDIYKITMGEAMKINPEKVVGDLRDQAKVFLLAQTYDRHPETIARLMGWPIEDALYYCNRFWAANPEIAERSNRDKATALVGEPVVTELGRQQVFPLEACEISPEDILGKKPMYIWGEGIGMDFLEIFRTVGNFRIQSVGADLTNIAMVNLYQAKHGDKPHPIQDLDFEEAHTVHDALWYTVRKEHCLALAKIVNEYMTAAGEEIGMPVPIAGEAHAGVTLMKRDLVEVYSA